MLHIITRSPFDNSALSQCLAVAQPGDCVLLLGDAVYATCQASDAFAGLDVQLIAEDARARGLPDVPWAKSIDYRDMVRLTEQHQPIQTWF